MKELNNKGFMLAEILAVTVVVMVIFTAVYINFLPAIGEYEKRVNYNDIDSTYTLFYFRKLYLNEEFDLSVKEYITLYDGKSCLNINNEALEFCNRFAKEAEVEELILTKYNIVSLKDNYEGILENYISYLPDYLNSVYDERDQYTEIPCQGETCESKLFYRIKTDEEWGKWKTESCNTELDSCESKTLYFDNKEIYRLIIKTKNGYGSTPLLLRINNDKKGPECQFVNVNPNYIFTNEKATFTLNCTDYYFKDSEIKISDFDIFDDNYLLDHTIVIESVEKEKTDKGYKYKIIINTLNIPNDHNTVIRLKLKQNVVNDIFNNKNNTSDYSEELFINNIKDEEPA